MRMQILNHWATRKLQNVTNFEFLISWVSRLNLAQIIFWGREKNVKKKKKRTYKLRIGTSLLGPVAKLCTSNTGEKSLIPDGGTRIPHAAQCGQKKKKKKKLTDCIPC